MSLLFHLGTLGTILIWQYCCHSRSCLSLSLLYILDRKLANQDRILTWSHNCHLILQIQLPHKVIWFGQQDCPICMIFLLYWLQSGWYLAATVSSKTCTNSITVLISDLTTPVSKECYNVLQTWSVKFEKCGCLTGREGFTHGSTILHCGNCGIHFRLM